MLSLGLDVEVVASAYAEASIPELHPRELALTHARRKAGGAERSARLIVAADTVVDVDGVALGKPRDRAESRAMIEQLSGRAHDVHTAFALRYDAANQTVVHCRTTRVYFRRLEARTIESYVAGGDGLDKAGAYGIQGFAATLVERIDGDYFTVVGFPLAAFAEAIALFNFELVARTPNGLPLVEMPA